MKRGITKRLICVLSAFVIALGSSAQVLALLAPDAAATQETIMEYVNAYDHDSAFILQEGIDSGDDILDWYVDGDSFLDHLDTAVHEECHAFTHGNFWGSTRIYAGDGKSFKVKESKVFDTVEMAKDIPEELRTFRYDNYIGEKADKIMGSRQLGAFGLLDELNAYSWGFNSDISAYSYLDEAGADPEIWQKYI